MTNTTRQRFGGGGCEPNLDGLDKIYGADVYAQPVKQIESWSTKYHKSGYL